MPTSDSKSFTLKPKRHFVRNVLVTVVLFYGIPLLAHAVWTHYAERNLQSRIDALRGAGEPVLPDDFRPTSSYLPGNAASDITAAATILDDDTVHSVSVNRAPATQPVAEEAWPYLTAAVEWFEPALRRIDRGQTKPNCQWSHTFRSPVMSNLCVPELNECDTVADLLITSSQVEHRRGRDDIVLRRLQQLDWLAQVCDRSPSEVAHSVSLRINWRLTEQIEAVAPSLHVDDAATGGTRHSAVHALIAALLDESSTTTGLRDGLRARRMAKLDCLDSFLIEERTFWTSSQRYFLRPWLCRMETACIDQSAAASTAALESHDWPTAHSQLDRIQPITGFLASIVDVRDFVPRHVQFHFEALANRRLAAAALAIRLFAIDHSNKLPANLEALVPAYLPKVPLDPMAANDQFVRYLSDGDHPVLYSVGLNGIDDSASEAALPGEFGDLSVWQRLDRVFYLSLASRPELIVSRPGADGTYMVEAGYDDRTPWERHDPISPDWHPPADQDLTPR